MNFINLDKFSCLCSLLLSMYHKLSHMYRNSRCYLFMLVLESHSAMLHDNKSGLCTQELLVVVHWGLYGYSNNLHARQTPYQQYYISDPNFRCNLTSNFWIWNMFSEPCAKQVRIYSGWLYISASGCLAACLTILGSQC